MNDFSLSDDGLFRILFDQMPQLGWTARPDGYIDFYNSGWYEYTGTTLEQMRGWGWKSVHHPEMVEIVTEQWQRSIANGTDFEMEFPLRDRNGNYRWFLTRVEPIRNEEGEIIRWVGVNTDVTTTRELQRSLEQERQNLRKIFELAPAFMAKLHGPQHVFEVANPAYMRLVGEDRELLGLPVVEALPEIEGQGFIELLDSVYATGEPFIGNEVRVLLRGEERFVDFVYQATRDAEGAIDGIFAHGTDVTIQVRARRQVEQQAESLREANQLKDQFLATLSHELRTPMTAVLGWARLLRMGLPDSEMDAAIDAIEKSAEAQAQLIDDVLDMSRIRAGKLVLDPHPVDLVAVAQAAATSVRPAADAKNIELSTIFPPKSSKIFGDEGRLQQVVWNLLSNAVKFTPKSGAVALEIEEIGSKIRLSVRDTGSGIDSALLPHIFEPFRQGDSSSTRVHGGIGLGLSIVRQIVELHGGIVFAKSNGTDQGALFVVELPILETQVLANAADASDEATEPVKADLDLPLLDGLKILVVDDQTHTREVVGAILRKARATVVLAGSVREALVLFAEQQPDVVVCDVAMPYEDGYAFLREVRAGNTEVASTPIVALTAFGRPEDRRRALKAGFTAYLKKPVDPRTLAQTVLEAMRLKGKLGSEPEF